MKTPRPQRLTAFQSLMRGWSELAPYNFIHAMRLDSPADIERWRSAVRTSMRALGFEDSSVEITSTDIEAHLEAELNRAFSPGQIPLRFFVLHPPEGGHWFGVVIDHWLADDFSCRALLQQILSTYQTQGDGIVQSSLKWSESVPARRFWFVEWTAFLKQAAMLRSARRTPLRDPMDFRMQTFRHELPIGALRGIHVLAKHNGATVHDVLLAAAAQVFGAAFKWREGQRDAVALASAMDTRRFEIGDAKCGFGLLLGQYIIVQRQPEEISISELIARVARQTRLAKALAGTDVFAPTLMLSRLLRSRRAKATLFARGAPLVAGLSNVNLTGSWIEAASIAEYRRVGPTGPVVPMVLMITTLNGRIYVDVTFRSTAFSRHEADNLIAAFAKRLSPNEK